MIKDMTKSRRIKTGIAAGILAAAAIVLFTARGEQQKPQEGGQKMGQEAAVTIVKAKKPERGDISLTTGLTGVVEPSDVVHVYAKAAGDVTGVLVKAGDTVSQGQPLFEIDTEQVESAKNSVDSAAVALSEAQSNLSRSQALYAGGYLSQQEYEQSDNAVKSARLQYESAKLNYEKQLEYSLVTSPISGRVEACEIEVHDRVSQSQELCVISGEGDTRVSFYVTQRMMENLHTGDQATVHKNGTSYEAVISEISAMVDEDTGLFKIKAQIDAAKAIAAGSTVKLDLVTQQARDALLVPVDAIYYSGGNAYVYLYQDGKASMVQVETGLEDSERVQILSGLSGGELVVSTWSSNLYEGAKIRLREDSGGTDAQGEKAVQDNKQDAGQTDNETAQEKQGA